MTALEEAQYSVCFEFDDLEIDKFLEHTNRRFDIVDSTMSSFEKVSKKLPMKLVQFWKFIPHSPTRKGTKFDGFSHRAQCFFGAVIPSSIESLELIMKYLFIVFDIMTDDDIRIIEIGEKSIHTLSNHGLISDVSVIDMMDLARSKRYRNRWFHIFIDTINLGQNAISTHLEEDARKLDNIGLYLEWTFSLYKTSCFSVKDKYLHSGIVSKIDTMQKILIFLPLSYNPSENDMPS